MSLRPALVRAAAVAFVAATALYSAVWMYTVDRLPTVLLGVVTATEGDAVVVRGVHPGGAAERAGVRPGDRLTALGGASVRAQPDVVSILYRYRPGDPVAVTVLRAGTSMTFGAVLAPRVESVGALASIPARVTQFLLRMYPALFVVATAAVLLLKPDDRHAWLLAILFAGFIAGAPVRDAQIPPALRGPLLAYRLLFNGMAPAVFLFLFSVFPTRSPLDARWPWLKWAWVAAGAAVSLPLAVWAGIAGSSAPVEAFTRRVSGPWLAVAGTVYVFGGFLLGFLLLAAGALHRDTTVRRKSRVVIAGTLAGFGPIFVLVTVAESTGREPYDFPLWVWAPCVILLSLLPLSYAYAVVKHRVLEIPALLRRSARYLLVQRGAVGLLVVLGLAATLAFATWFARVLAPGRERAAIALGAGFGTVLVAAGSRLQQRVRERLDRAFFRRAYDARLVLQDLADQARAAGSREELASLIERHVTSALHPHWMSVHLEAEDGALQLFAGRLPPQWRRLELPPSLAADLARHPHPREVTSGAEKGLLAPLAPLSPECVVPVLGRQARLVGLLLLGAPLSEEPYSREDRRLLATVANQSATALESIALAEQMAVRLEAERRAGHEMDLAQQVQRRLLPRDPPSLSTLECAGRCIQSRAVGGDYFDFLELEGGRIGLVLADVSGKGLPAALIMASLQASLRTLLSQPAADLRDKLRAVDRLLYQWSEPNRYATLFLGVYEDASRVLRYVNCGHLPPLVLRRDVAVERLQPTAPVLGLLEDWDCATAQTRLGPDDLVAIFSDGMTEAFDGEGEEFGEERLRQCLQAHRDRPLPALLDAVVAEVRAFGGARQDDDQTLVVARGRA